jgi:hypothetical protein
MKKYIVHCQSGRFFESFTIAADNYEDAISIGRRRCRLEGIRFRSVRLAK